LVSQSDFGGVISQKSSGGRIVRAPASIFGLFGKPKNAPEMNRLGVSHFDELANEAVLVSFLHRQRRMVRSIGVAVGNQLDSIISPKAKIKHAVKISIAQNCG
jgi:hypothetical protein